MYTEKTIQLMHFFAEKNGGEISDVKLMKLLYFADRLSIETSGYPLSYDDYFSMNRGPVLSGAKRLIDNYSNGQYRSLFEQARSGNSPQNFPLKVVSLKKVGSDINDFGNADFDLLSTQDHEVLEKIFSKMGGMDDDAIALHSHDSSVCPEWKWPDGGRLAITIESILQKLGYSSEEILTHAADIKYFKDVVYKD